MSDTICFQIVYNFPFGKAYFNLRTLDILFLDCVRYFFKHFVKLLSCRLLQAIKQLKEQKKR